MKTKGFTLIELLVVIAIVAILSGIVLLLFKPQELLKRGRDANRITDLEGIQKAINFILQDHNNDTSLLCSGGNPPCQGKSNDGSSNVRAIDGTGWVKVDLSAEKSFTYVVLPVDPSNNLENYYNYFSNGQFYELNALFESEQYKTQQTKDGGNNNNIYELGTNLSLLN